MPEHEDKRATELEDLARLKRVLANQEKLPAFSSQLFHPEYNPPMYYKTPPSRPIATEVMRVFNTGIGNGETILDTRLLSINGWLTPKGELYACAWRNHHAVLNHFNIRSELVAEKMGFIKLSDMHWHIEGRYESIEITMEQMKVIDAWHEVNGLIKDYFEDCNKYRNGNTEGKTP